MRKMEVLRLRVTDGSREKLLNQLRTDHEAMKSWHGIERVEVYLSKVLETDLAVHLHWEADALQEVKSGLAEEISGGLRDHGIVHHTMWIHGGNNHEK